MKLSSLSFRAVLSVALLGALTAVSHAASSLSVARLRCEYAENPIGIDSLQPRLSWVLESGARGQRQTAFQVLVSATPDALQQGRGDLWDSGRIEGGQSIQVVYGGRPAVSRQRCYWKVRVWDKDGQPAESAPAYWETGLLAPADWKASWIGWQPGATSENLFQDARWIWYPEGNPAAGAPPGQRLFRKIVEVPEGAVVRQARMNVTCDDQFVLSINGKTAGKSSGKKDAWRSPKSFDVKSFLKPGRNILSVQATNESASAGLIARLNVELAAGPAIVAVTDRSWAAANKPAAGWLAPEFDAAAWPAAKEIAAYGEGPWGKPGSSPNLGRPPYLRKSVAWEKPVAKARLYASALGVYEFHVNGARVSADFFNPGWTDYKKRVQYHTYDITPLLKPGANALGILLGDGWYAGYVGLGGPQRYGPQAFALAQVEVEFADGSRQTIATDASWKAASSPLLQSDMLMGETYDARAEIPGWASPDFNDSSWKPVTVAKFDAPLVAAPDAPVRPLIELKPRARTEPKPGCYIFDMGQNMVGWARLKVQGTNGQTVMLRFAEMLNPDGTIYITNLRGAKATDRYTLKGGGAEVFEPRFTFHGFRYVEITGYTGQPELDCLTGVVAYSDTPPAGQFECSSPMVNQLQSNIVWGQRGNFLAVPTDCPQRDERLGWMGDAQVFIRTATYNMDVSRFFTKWCQDVEDAQRPNGAFTDVSPFVCCGAGTAAWGDAGLICPWTVYRVYGDTRILERHYAAGARWIEYLKSHSKGLLRPAEGYGDWLSIQADTPKDVLATAYFALSTKLMARSATALGRGDDARRYEELFAQIKAAFNTAYVTRDGWVKGRTQTGQLLALAFDLAPEPLREAVASHLVENIRAKGNHLSTGFVGVGILTPTLTRAGHSDVAYQLLNQDTFPGWLYSVKNGATTIWERWDGWTHEKGFQDPGMNSFNHYSLGSVGEWMFDTVAGIGLDPAVPAYKHIIINPRPGGGLTYAKARFDSVHGRITTDWRLVDGRFELAVTIPANTTATVFVPAASGEVVQENGAPAARSEGVRFVRMQDGAAVFEVGSGRYQFAAPAR